MGGSRLPFVSLLTLGLVFGLPCVQSGLFTKVDDLRTNAYDFVIVGGGTAGNVLANRLTEDTRFSVLVIEAGPSNEGLLPSMIPFWGLTLVPYSPYTWNYSTAPQQGLNGRSLSYGQGKVLGGSSSINFGASTRGADDEYNRWAKLTGDEAWSWENLEPYYIKTFHLVSSVDGHDTSGQVDPNIHGRGPLQVSLPNYQTGIDRRVNDSTGHKRSEFPFNLDMNSGDTIGIGYTQNTIGRGERSSSVTAHLQPALERPNVDVLVEHQATRVLSNGVDDRGRVIFNGVEIATGPAAPKHTIFAGKEIILSAGAIGTPQLLMLSGVGNASALHDLGIKTLVDSPDVGQNLQDHLVLSNYFEVNTTSSTIDTLVRNSSFAEAYLEEWTSNRTGVFSYTGVNSIGFLRMAESASITDSIEDPSAGPRAGHFELIFIDGFFPSSAESAPSEGFFLSVCSAVTSPTSRGTLSLRSSNPFDFPVVNPNYLATPFDEQATIAAVRASRRFVKRKPWHGYVLNRFGIMGDAETDDEIIAAARATYQTMWHPVGTVRMGPMHGSRGALDPHLRVKGAKGLRVVDASAFPVIPAVHTATPVYILAERAADFILEEWAGRESILSSIYLLGNFKLALQHLYVL